MPKPPLLLPDFQNTSSVASMANVGQIFFTQKQCTMKKAILLTFLLLLIFSFQAMSQYLIANSDQQLPAESIETMETNQFCSNLPTIPSGGFCDCPAGSVVVGYQGWTGFSWGPDVLSEFSLICKVLNPDGTLGTATTVTCSNGDEQTITAIAPIEATLGSVMVGAQTNIGCGFDGFFGYEMPITDVLAANPISNATPMPAIGGNGGSINPVQLVPDGHLIIGMETFIDSTKSDIVGGVAWRYAQITQVVKATGGLLINELSQGTGGANSGEYVELLVYNGGTTESCQTCLDLRGWIMDDNNGYFGGGSGFGIGAGALRFANVPEWECVPLGTLILVYDELYDFAANGRPLPPDDLVGNDGNCLYVLPGSSNLFEADNLFPNSSNSLYNNATWTGIPAWNPSVLVGNLLNDFDDSFFLIPPNNPDDTPNTLYTPYHSMSWGNNDATSDSDPFTIYLGSIDYGGSVTALAGLPTTYDLLAVSGGETPGAPNNTANQDWIAGMNTCNYIPPTITATDDIVCFGDDAAMIDVEIAGGVAPYDWGVVNQNDPMTTVSMGIIPVMPAAPFPLNIPLNLTQNVSEVNAYNITITDANGCTDSASASVIYAPINPSIEPALVTTCGGLGSLTVLPNGGSYGIEWSTGSAFPTINGLPTGGYAVTVSDGTCAEEHYGLVTTVLPPNACVDVSAIITRIDFPALNDGLTNGSEWVIDIDGNSWIFDVPLMGTDSLQDAKDLIKLSPIDPIGACNTAPLEIPFGTYNPPVGSPFTANISIHESDNDTDDDPHNCDYDGDDISATDSGNDGVDDFLGAASVSFFLDGSGNIITVPTAAGQVLIEYVLTCSPSTLAPPDVDNTTLEFCEGTDNNLLITATASGEPGAFFTWYYATDSADPLNSLMTVPLGTDGDNDETLKPAVFFTQDSTVYVTQTLNGCESEGTLINVIVNQSPIVNIPPASLCDDGMGGTTSATISPIVIEGDGNYTYDWVSVPEDYDGLTDQANIITSVVGSYTLVVTDGNMCSSPPTSILVSANTPPEVGIIITSPTTCFGEIFDVTVSTIDNDNDDNDNYEFSWAISPPNVSIIFDVDSPDATIVAPTTDVTLTVTVTDSNGCTSTDEIDITVNDTPQFPPDLPEILVCVPTYTSSNLTELDDAIIDPLIGTVTWYQSGAPSGAGFPIVDPTNINVTINDAMPIYALITNDATLCQNEMEITVKTDITPDADAGVDDSVCNISNPFILTGNFPANHTGSWSGTNVTNTTNGMAEFDPTGLADGDYTFTYTLVSQFGCTDSDEVIIKVTPPSDIVIDVTNTSDCGAADGEISISTTNGIADVLWADGANNNPRTNLSPGGYAVTVTDNSGCMTEDYILVSTDIPDGCLDVTVDITRVNFPALGDGTGSTEWVLNFDGAAWVFATGNAGTDGLVELESLLENQQAGDCSPIPIELTSISYDVSTSPTASIPFIIFESDKPIGVDVHSCTYEPNDPSGNGPGAIDSGNGTGDDLLFDGIANFDLSSSGVITIPLLSGIGSIEIEYILTCAPSTFTVDAGVDRTVCENEDPFLIEGILPTTGQTATWTGNGITDNGDGTATFNPNNLSGAQVLTYEISNGTGCTASDVITITVDSAPTAFVFPTNATCGGTGGTATASPAGADAYAWSYNGNPLSSTSNQLTGLAPGLYSVTITENGCQSVAANVVSTDISDPSCTNITAHFTRFNTPVLPDIPGLEDDTLWVVNLQGVNSGSWIINVPTAGTNGLADASELAVDPADINTETCNLPPYEIQVEDGPNCDNILPVDVFIIIKDDKIPPHSCNFESSDIQSPTETVSIDLNSTDNIIELAVSIYTVEIEYYLTCTPPITPAPAVFAGLQTNYCQGETVDMLPDTDDNDIEGTWNPTTINDMTSGAYTFTPICSECAEPFTLNVAIDEPTVPVFNFVTETTYCVGDLAQTLTSSSSNGIVGNWQINPMGVPTNVSSIDTSIPGETTYIFVPAGDACVDSFKIDITVNALPTVDAGMDNTVCEGAGIVQLSGSPSTGGTGVWTSTAALTDNGNGTASFDPTGLSGAITFTYTFEDANGCENDADVIITVNATPAPPDTDCYEMAMFNMTTCSWDVTGEQDPEPTDLECWQTTTFDDATCTWIISGEQEPEPTDLECWQTTAFDDATCAWITSGEQEPEPTDLECWQTTTFDDATCAWITSGEQEPEPTDLECWQTTTFDDVTCTWIISGEQEPEPTDLECWETTTFDDATCAWITSGEQEPGPTDLECWQTTAFDDATCTWITSGEQEPEPTDLECWQTTTFDDATCAWIISGEQEPVDDGCEFTDDSFDDVTCMAVNVSNCPDGTLLDEVNCACVEDVILGCTNPCATNYNPDATQDDGSCLLPEEPTDLECWQTTTFDDATCAWIISGEQDPEPTDLECWQTTTFDDVTCAWITSGEQEPEPTDLECWQTTAFDDATCAWITSGEQEPEPTDLECWQTTTFNDATCMWEIESGDSFAIDLIDLNSPSCNGTDDGSITISTTGGTPPLMYSINGVDLQSSSTFDGLTAGTYELLINDANGCALDSMVQLLDPAMLELSLTGGGASCIGGDGQATVTASGGTGDYTYQWDDANAQTSGTAGGLNPGQYNVTVQDTNGCTATGGVTIDSNSDVLIDNIATTPNTCSSADGTLAITGSGGESPYMYSIDNGITFQADSLFEGLAGGTYTIVIQDLQGCEASSTASILTDEEFSFPLVDTLYILNGNPETVMLPDGANYTWSPMFDLECNDNCSVVEILVTEETIFTVTATTFDGCEATQTITVIPIKGVIVPDIISPNGDGDNETFQVEGIENFPQNELSVYNRWGERVYYAQPYSNTDPWDGFRNGRIVPHGAYYYILELNVTEIPTLKGRVFIID